MGRSISMNDASMRGLLAGRKTQTRRLPRLQPFLGGYYEPPISLDAVYERSARFSATAYGGGAIVEDTIAFSYAVGSRLLVREAMVSIDGACAYRAGCKLVTVDGATQPWCYRRLETPAQFMPGRFSRFALTVTNVRVQRLQEISEADAEAEGVEPVLVSPDGGSCPHIEGYAAVWDAINGNRYPWESNPWVVAVSFISERIGIS